MTEEMLTLARRAVACPKWRWMPGMLAAPSEGAWMVTPPLRLTDKRHRNYPDEYDWPHDLGLRLPVLTDPATVGCVLALVREAWGDPGFYVTRSGIYIKDTDILGWDSFGLLRGMGWGTLYRSEVDALVAALEAAP